jgi:hypothetical protein
MCEKCFVDFNGSGTSQNTFDAVKGGLMSKLPGLRFAEIDAARMIDFKVYLGAPLTGGDNIIRFLLMSLSVERQNHAATRDREDSYLHENIYLSSEEDKLRRALVGARDVLVKLSTCGCALAVIDEALTNGETA